MPGMHLTFPSIGHTPICYNHQKFKNLAIDLVNCLDGLGVSAGLNEFLLGLCASNMATIILSPMIVLAETATSHSMKHERSETHFITSHLPPLASLTNGIGKRSPLV